MIDEEVKRLAKKELLQAIAYFVERQHLVAQAMREMGLNLEEVGKYGAIAWISHPGADTSKLDELYQQASNDKERDFIQIAIRAKHASCLRKEFGKIKMTTSGSIACTVVAVF